MTNCCPRPRMRWNGAIGAIARCKKVSTVCAPKSRSRHELRLICGEKPGARGVATLFTPYMRHGQDESNPVSLLQCQQVAVTEFRCPKCGASLVEMHYKGIEIDKYSRCQGIWLDSGELERILPE